MARYPEIDALRTIAIFMMVVYHTLWDLENLYGWPILRSLGVGGRLFARTTAILFLLLVGVNFAIARLRNPSYERVLWRAARILGAAILVSLATYMFDPETFVRFGVLHLIGVSVLLLPLSASLREWNALLGIAVIALGTAPEGMTVGTPMLLPLGITPPHFTTVDYFPLFPWLGVILLGVSVGHLLYIRAPAWRRFSILTSRFSILTWPGRHSLLLYLLHQPLILVTITLILGKPTL
jgi:uncharacterized membrane protein